MHRLLTAATVVASLALLSAAPAAAQGECAMEVEPSQIRAGESTTVTAIGFAGDAEIEFHIVLEDGDTDIQRYKMDADGDFERGFTFEAPGTYTLRLILPESECGAEAQLVVTPLPDTSTASLSTAGEEQDRSLGAPWILAVLGVLAGLTFAGRLAVRARLG